MEGWLGLVIGTHLALVTTPRDVKDTAFSLGLANPNADQKCGGLAPSPSITLPLDPLPG